jgi:signal transduction histidine kinase/integral membrane sensor domain MASE1
MPPFHTAPRLLYTTQLGGLLLAYVVSGTLGLRLDAVSGFAALVWPPTGIALAALLLFGIRLWPGIALGAFLVNTLAGAPLGAALGISVGNTLEAVIAVQLLRRIGFHPSLSRVRDVLGLVVLAAGVSTVVSATLGVFCLRLAGIVDSSSWFPAWKAWWLGDALGDLIVAPLLLVWTSRPRASLRGWRSLEAVALLLVLLAVAVAVFHNPDDRSTFELLRWPYVLFPFLVWGALRFQQHGGVICTFLVSVIAVACTTLGYGPFLSQNLSESLLALQSFLGISAVTVLVLAATVAERDLMLTRLQTKEAQLRIDVDERKRSEQALRRTEDQFRLLADASQVLSESLDYKATLDALSALVVPRFADWYAVDLLEADGVQTQIAIAHSDPAKVQLAHEFRARYPPRSDAPRGVPHVLRTGTSELYPEITDELLRIAALDEEQYRMARDLSLYSAMVVPLSARGRVFGAMSLVSAESRKRYTESDLALAQELARRAALAVDNARLYQEAQKAIEDATQAIRARDEFLSIASHELRTPLTSLELQVSMLARSAAKIDGAFVPAEKVTSKVEIIGRQVERLTGLVENLLDVSRAVAGRLMLQPEETSFKAVVEEVAGRLREQMARAGCRLLLQADDPCVGRWDRLRLDQIVTNLLSNAVKYGPGKPIEIRLQSREGAALLTVRDHGIGILPEDQARIFERFERAVSARHFGGLGLGLWIVKQIVTAMGGTISVKSETGQGSEFTVVLPKQETPHPEADPEGKLADESKGPTLH